MTINENLLVVASEECSEISQAISKAIRFGMQNHNPYNNGTNNEYEILVEYYQLQAVFEMLVERGIVRKLTDDEIDTIVADKKAKVKHYEELSSSLGIVRV